MKMLRGIATARLFCAGLFVAALAAGPQLLGQETPQAPPNVPTTPQTPPEPPATVRGVVLNQATGQPLPRALVRIQGTPERGALTDGEGRFVIHGVPAGTQIFSVTKPGFQEQMGSDDGPQALSHSVTVSGSMPELTFSLAPKNAIYGHVTLSTGAPAEGIGLVLVRRSVADGRAGWQQGEHHITTPDGSFRFPGLRDGVYLLMTEPEFDSRHATEPKCSANAPAQMPGYAIEFYGGGVDLSGAARIVVAGGQSAEVNLALNLTMFHLVEAKVARIPVGADWGINQSVHDLSGQALEYPIHEEKDHTLCVYLPDGSYTLEVQASSQQNEQALAQAGEKRLRDLLGLLDFSVDGQPARNLRVALSPGPLTAIHMRYEPGPPPPVKLAPQSQDGRTAIDEERADPDADPLTLSLVRANVVPAQGESDSEAIRVGENDYELDSVPPGSYWVHASAARQGVCLGAVTAGGQNLARTPWVVGASAPGMPIDVILRSDCAKLTVQMPASLSAGSAGEGANLFVYAVPDFDSLEGGYQTQIQQFGERTATIEDITPGPYRVFAFRTPQSIEFRNDAAIDRLGPGQRITLEPGANANLVLEGISK